jgi:hypothetical protein
VIGQGYRVIYRETHSSRRTAGNRHASSRTCQHSTDFKPPCRRLGQTTWRQRRRHRHA